MTDQIIRGGSWRDFQIDARVDYRFDFRPNNLVDYLGFRVIKKSQQNYPAVRGGSWSYHRDYAHCAARYRLRPGFRYSSFGFRVLKQRSTQ